MQIPKGIRSWHVASGKSNHECRLLNGNLHGKIPRHELDDWSEATVGSADTEAGESHLRDRSVDDALVAVFVVQTFGYLQVRF